MEEQKNNEVKNEHSCCDHSGKNSKCFCLKHGGVYMLIKLFIILVIFLIGICVGINAVGHKQERFLGKDFRGEVGCPMMRGENKVGENKGCALQNKAAVPTDNKVQETGTTTVK